MGSFHYGTLNTKTLCKREAELEHALKNVNFNIIGLSEVRKVGEALIEQENGDLFYYKGTTPGQKRVGLIIRNSVKYMVHEITAVSERVMLLVLTAKRSKVTIIQTYAPTASSSEQKVEDL